MGKGVKGEVGSKGLLDVEVVEKEEEEGGVKVERGINVGMEWFHRHARVYVCVCVCVCGRGGGWGLGIAFEW